jgi:photosystem II stability/assembly factor-like uncharacterized protein
LYTVAIHPLSPTLLLAGSGNWEPVGGQIFKTDNSGEDWYPVSPEFTNAVTFAFNPHSPTVVYAGTQYGGIKKSIDSGNTWSSANMGLPTKAYNITSVVLHPTYPEQLYAATSRGLYVSYNDAGEWHPLWENIDANELLIYPADTDIMYLGTGNGIYVSSNAGSSWSLLGPCGVNVSINHLAFDPFNHDIFWAVTSDGVWQCLQP